jgi:hypothetical protein
MAANQLRLWFASMAYVLVEAIRRLALQATDLADATCGTIRRKPARRLSRAPRPDRADDHRHADPARRSPHAGRAVLDIRTRLAR